MQLGSADDLASQNVALIVSTETSHDADRGWKPSGKAACIGDSAGGSVIVGFASIRLEPPIETLIGKEPRADIVTQCFSGDCRNYWGTGRPIPGSWRVGRVECAAMWATEEAG